MHRVRAKQGTSQGFSGWGVWSVVLLLFGLGVGVRGCFPFEGSGGADLVFYVENRSAEPVHLQVIADREHLFAVDLEAAPSPASSGVPGLEVRVRVERFPRELEVREVLRELRARFSLEEHPLPPGYGYRIVVSEQGIELFANYATTR